MGRESHYVAFFGKDQKLHFCIYVGRENHQLIESVKEGFLKAIEDSVSHIIFQINILKRKFDFNKDEHLIKFAKEAASIIKTLSSPVEKDF